MENTVVPELLTTRCTACTVTWVLAMAESEVAWTETTRLYTESSEAVAVMVKEYVLPTVGRVPEVMASVRTACCPDHLFRNGKPRLAFRAYRPFLGMNIQIMQ